MPVEPLFFRMLPDLEEVLKEKGKRGTILGNSKVYSLAYEVNIVLLAEGERGMNLMMTKIMCFRNKRCKVEYKWKNNGERVELVVEFCYLGFW